MQSMRSAPAMSECSTRGSTRDCGAFGLRTAKRSNPTRELPAPSAQAWPSSACVTAWRRCWQRWPAVQANKRMPRQRYSPAEIDYPRRLFETEFDERLPYATRVNSREAYPGVLRPLDLTAV